MGNVGDRRRLSGERETTQYAPAPEYPPTFTKKGQFIFPRPDSAKFAEIKQVIIEGSARFYTGRGDESGEMPDVIFDRDPSHDPELETFITACSKIEGQTSAELINAASEQLDSFNTIATREWQPIAEPFIERNTVMPIGEFIKNQVGDCRIINGLFSVCLNSVPALAAEGYFIWQYVKVEEEGWGGMDHATVLWDSRSNTDKYIVDAYWKQYHGVKLNDAFGEGCYREGTKTSDSACTIFDGLNKEINATERTLIQVEIYETFPIVKYFNQIAYDY